MRNLLETSIETGVGIAHQANAVYDNLKKKEVILEEARRIEESFHTDPTLTKRDRANHDYHIRLRIASSEAAVAAERARFDTLCDAANFALNRTFQHDDDFSPVD